MMNESENGLKIVCRLRPLVENDNGNVAEDNRPNIVAVNEKMVSLQSDNVEEHFEFDQVFDDHCGQKEIFNKIAYPLIESLLNGNDCLLFAYGLTSSGKTYTLNGTPNYPGIIPRSIGFLFEMITENRINKREFILPNCQNGFVFNSQMNWNIEHDDESAVGGEQLHSQQPESVYKDVHDFWFEEAVNSISANRKKFINTINEWSKVKIELDAELYMTRDQIGHNRRFSLFISFVEIYNNYIYDLLEINQPFKSRQSRQLQNDANQMVYVNCKQIEVTNLDEAFKVYLYGLQNRQIGRTEMNDYSSRSHSVFTIKLVYYDEDNEGLQMVQLKPELKVNQFSIVDLAGVERIDRTKTSGMKLYEASNINNSLMALRSCLDAIKKNQENANRKNYRPLLVQYRQSKLTHFFKRFFEFPAQIRMMICIKPDVEDYEQNLRVLNFGQKVQKIIIEQDKNVLDDWENNGKQWQELNDEIIIDKSLLERWSASTFNAEHYNNKPLPLAIEDMRKFLQSYQKNLNEMFSKMEIILQKLDINLSRMPESQMDRKSLTIRRHRYDFMNVCGKLLRWHKPSHETSSPSTMGNCPKMTNRSDTITQSITVEQENFDKTRNDCNSHNNDNCTNNHLFKKTLIQEFHRELLIWKSEGIELENKFSSLILNLDHYVDRSFVPIASVSCYSKMMNNNDKKLSSYSLNTNNKKSRQQENSDVFHRLYYGQSSAMVSSSSTIRRQQRNTRLLKQQQQSSSLALLNQNNQRLSLSKTTMVNYRSQQQRKICPSTISLTQSKRTNTNRVRRPLSDKIRNLCRKFEPTIDSAVVPYNSNHIQNNDDDNVNMKTPTTANTTNRNISRVVGKTPSTVKSSNWLQRRTILQHQQQLRNISPWRI